MAVFLHIRITLFPSESRDTILGEHKIENCVYINIILCPGDVVQVGCWFRYAFIVRTHVGNVGKK